MATNTSSERRVVSATVQWVALAVFAILAVLAAFVYFGEDSTGGGGGHSGAPAASTVR